MPVRALGSFLQARCYGLVSRPEGLVSMPVRALGSFLHGNGDLRNQRGRCLVSMPVRALGSFLPGVDVRRSLDEGLSGFNAR